MQKSSLFSVGMGFAILIGTPASAQEAGDSFVKVAAARTKLVDKGDVFVDGVQDPGAAYKTRDTFHEVITAGHYVINGVAIEGSLASPSTTNNIPAGSLAGLPNLGDDEFITASLGASFHPVKGRLSPYVGGGIQLQITTQERDGLAVGLDIPNAHGPYVNAGVDYKVNKRWGMFADVRKAWYSTNASGRLPRDATYTTFSQVDANAVLDPLTIQFGLAAHFGKNSGDEAVEFDNDMSRRWSLKVGASSLRLRDEAQMIVGGTPLTGEGISTFEHQTLSVQIGYFLTDAIAVNATVGLPPKIDVFAAGSIGALPTLGQVRYGPTAFTLQYHPLVSGRFRPYVGAGASYMIVFGTNDGAFQNLHVDNDLAPVFEAGTDIMVGRNWGLFFDVKNALLRPDTRGTFGGAPVDAKVKLDPLVFSTGLSLRL